MNIGFPSTTFLTYLKQNWFKIALVGLVVFIFFEKDFNFQLNLKAPAPQQEDLQRLHNKPTPRAAKKKEYMSENLASPKEESKSILDHFQWPSIGGESSSVSTSYSEFSKADEAAVEDYLKRFAKVAVNEHKKFAIPASIILANGLLQSHVGRRDMTRAGNNHFALPCTPDWQAESNTYQSSCYRHYENAWTSFRDHSLFITTGKYSDLKDLGKRDYQAWATALEEKGFSEEPNLGKELVQIIEKYGLQELD